MHIKKIDTWREIDSAYKYGKLYIWTVCPEVWRDTEEYYDPHWHPVTELPCWGPEWLGRERFGVR